MDIKDISVPQVYLESADFRFFLKWLGECLEKIKYDTENLSDLYDPLRCPEELIWALADTMGYKFDSRLPSSFNRLVLVYFMSMIRNRGSKDGVTLAAEANLAQFHILMDAAGYTDEDGNEIEGKKILYNRLEDTSIPVNSVYVTPNTELGYIDVVYYSTKVPTDACIEYVRPLGMYIFQHAGVDFQARTKITVDARLTDERDQVGLSPNFGPTQVGHYTRYDYASLQRGHAPRTDSQIPLEQNDTTHLRDQVWERNSEYEKAKAPRDEVNPGYRSLYSLQLANNEHIVKSLIDPVYSLGYGPQQIGVTYPDDYLKPELVDKYGVEYSKSFSDITNLYNWECNVPDWNIVSYIESTNVSNVKIRAMVGDERMYIKQEVTPNVEHKLKLKFKNTGSSLNYLVIYACGADQISALADKSKYWGNIPKLSNAKVNLFANIGNFTDAQLVFDTGSNSEIYVVIEGHELWDGQSYNWFFQDFKLCSPVARPYNLRYDRDLEESINGDSITAATGYEPDVYTNEDADDGRPADSTIIRPYPAVNMIMSQVGDAISLNADEKKDEKNGEYNSKYIVTKEENQSDIHIEEVDTDD